MKILVVLTKDVGYKFIPPQDGTIPFRMIPDEEIARAGGLRPPTTEDHVCPTTLNMISAFYRQTLPPTKS
jgi:hypothetical protein